jgi:hypothetical protein
MFNSAEEFIDTVQSAKKDWVKTFVTHETVAKAMNDYINTQTDYTKVAVKAINSFSTVISKEVNKAVDEVYSGANFKNMQEKVSNDIYSTFWKEAFKYYTPTTK